MIEKTYLSPDENLGEKMNKIKGLVKQYDTREFLPILKEHIIVLKLIADFLSIKKGNILPVNLIVGCLNMNATRLISRF
jgi:hypothetical protein